MAHTWTDYTLKVNEARPRGSTAAGIVRAEAVEDGAGSSLARYSPEFSQHGCQFRLDLLQPGVAQFVGQSIQMAVVLRPIAGIQFL